MRNLFKQQYQYSIQLHWNIYHLSYTAIEFF